MDDLMESIVDFIRVRQLNIALAGLLTLGYLVYQYWDLLMKGQPAEMDNDFRRSRLSRSRSRSRTKNYQDYKTVNSKRRGGCRKCHRRCYDCSLCDLEQ